MYIYFLNPKEQARLLTYPIIKALMSLREFAEHNTIAPSLKARIIA